MTASLSRFSLPAVVGMAALASFVAAPLAAQAVSNSAEFEAFVSFDAINGRLTPAVRER